MALKVFLLLMIVFTMSAAGSSGQGRAPSCRDVKETSVCTQEYTPVCGDDGVTYPNECSMCLSRLRNPALLIAKEGRCDSDKTVS
ncbi:hypothetical protein GJAV_G00167840 [Gymnothorax javanicus]|nr:hypothetical protein GJAV_G00167840 [Gymnothorax javanicus]